MDSPFGLTYGLAQMGAGASQGLVAANHENRTRDLQDRAYGLQQAQDAREQSLADMRQESIQRGLQDQDAALRAKIAFFQNNPILQGQRWPKLQILHDKAGLAAGHPDATTSTASPAPPASVVAPGPGLTPPVAGAAAPAVVKEQVRGSNRLGLAIAENKAKDTSDPDALMETANAHWNQAHTLAQRLHDAFATSGLDLNTREGQLYAAHLTDTFQPAIQQSMTAATEYRDKANAALGNLNRARANFYVQAGKMDLAKPYLEAVQAGEAKAALFDGATWNGNDLVLKNGANLPRSVVNAIVDGTGEDLQKALEKAQELVIKEMEARTAESRANASMARENRDPILERANEIARLDALYASLLANDPQRPIIANKVHNLRAMTGIDAAEAKTQGGIVQQYKVQAAERTAEEKADIERNRVIANSLYSTKEQKAEALGNLARYGESATPAPATGLVPKPAGAPLPATIQAKVDALRARHVPEATIQDALKRMGY